MGVTNALSLCTDSIAIKLENCVTYPAVTADTCDVLTNGTVYDDYEYVIKDNSTIVDSGVKTLQTVYKHAVNQNICTYAESSACVCEDY